MTLSSQSEHSRACTNSPHYSQPFLAGSWSIQTAPEGAVLLPALLCAPRSPRSLEHKHVLLMLSDTPTLKDALTGPEKDKWVHAIHSELNIRSEDVYDLVDPKTENIKNLLGNKIVLCRKCGATGKIERYKAHFTARGDHQHKLIDFDET